MKSFFTIEKASHAGFDYFTVKSKVLGQRGDISVYKPAGNHENLPVVILLHGVYGSHWAWSLKGRVHEVLEKGIREGTLPPMMLVMPSDGLFQDGSGYLKHHDADYEKWIVDEIPTLIKEQYKEVTKKSHFFLTGLSMGGYGALRLGAKNPNVFSAFSGLSSIINFSEFEQFIEDFGQLKSSVVSPENVSEVLLANRQNLKPFRFDCGENDDLYSANVAMHELLKKENIKHEFFTYPGEHSWEYWEKYIKESLLFFAQNIKKTN
ncbi:alpha/beta hydrolase [Arcticibacterium luteifluviistationis]|uniref:Acetyl esterase n=1 Tax=Arcticibacterium luteifluviistationis TaxID=1784714 RepID=A0A2Z4G6I5_9BACT|nr:alpha/beta hydrolase-fold protein [Arcticibacterium luteifluviistationis]AWV96749.1 acetyl esterase [Arcticibacterium luteifluviistationis]